jgi:anti-sigma factor RsiW
MYDKDMPRYTQAELEAYLDEALSPTDMAAMEAELRGRPDLLQQLATINARRDAGVHSLGEIWRRNRLSCPTREQLGSYLLGALDQEQATYVEFHLETIGCRYCKANHDDLRREQEESQDHAQRRRSKYFQSSAGHLRKRQK